MPSCESEEQNRPRKRQKTSANGSNDTSNKKSRGRPRVENEDATAADRRRTQIRLAQRAYRQRKESTIVSLQEQTTRLQNIIQQMTTSFDAFSTSAIRAGIADIYPSLAQELRQLADKFSSFKQSAEVSSEEEFNDNVEADDMVAELPMPTPTTRDPPNSLPMSTHTSDWITAVASPSTAVGAQVTRGPALTVAHETPTFGLEQPRGYSGRLKISGSTWTELPFGLLDIVVDGTTYPPEIHSLNGTPPMTRISTPPLECSLTTKSLAPDWTYSFAESTFARRLNRAALETALQILDTPKARSPVLDYVFRLSLTYMTVEQLREKFQLLLSRGINGDLDCWGTPFDHLGGAGLHYPREDGKAKLCGVSYHRNIRSIGLLPASLARRGDEPDPSQGHDINIDISGFEGEWFDPDDVEGYLKQEKGCQIDPKDSFAEVWVECEDETRGLVSGSLTFSQGLNLNVDLALDAGTMQLQLDSSGSSSHGWGATSSNESTAPDSVNTFLGANEPLGLSMGVTNIDNMGGLDSSTSIGQQLALGLTPDLNASILADAGNVGAEGFQSTSTQFPTPPLDVPLTDFGFSGTGTKRKKAAWVDVEKLVEELLKRAVCLGRSPGFRRQDVDEAFKSALINAF
ncbi:hypothetical protein M011DRAFT_411476 [Sporormia fimetaria CBS 119925]|uniref:BZIP domain-containing protein n=1 Tax=Sporormia fimetaria CBS 119925 TaxID=1340428 RepID=A0A6A6UZU7_9PLEO|nr:hypothetical protein M011DRAFT_411476 [Sporormia fimetaria CBS 119925]